MNQTVRILTRESNLAVTQAGMVRNALTRQHPHLKIELHPIRAIGDQYRDRWDELLREHPTTELTKRKWTFELEEAIASGEYDLAIHSGKDLPLEIRAGTTLLPVLPRADARDVFIGRSEEFAALRDGAVIGTDSHRRRTQLLRMRPDFRIVSHDGNVPTRLQKLRDSTQLDGIILAAAGLQRLQLQPPLLKRFSLAEMVPAAHQGILVAQSHQENSWLAEALQPLVHSPTQQAWLAERACLVALQADCETAAGVYAEIVGDLLRLTARGCSQDGQQWLEESQTHLSTDAVRAGELVAQSLLQRGILELLR